MRIAGDIQKISRNIQFSSQDVNSRKQADKLFQAKIETHEIGSTVRMSQPAARETHQQKMKKKFSTCDQHDFYH